MICSLSDTDPRMWLAPQKHRDMLRSLTSGDRCVLCKRYQCNNDSTRATYMTVFQPVKRIPCRPGTAGYPLNLLIFTRLHCTQIDQIFTV